MPINNNNNFANGLIDIAQENNLPTPPKQTKQTNHKEILRKKIKRFCVIKCNWTDEGDFWQADCPSGTGWISGDENNLKEMASVYYYCPSCGKEINWVPKPVETEYYTPENYEG